MLCNQEKDADVEDQGDEGAHSRIGSFISKGVGTCLIAERIKSS